MKAGFIQRAEDYIRKTALIIKGDTVLLSLSAGKDSMALYHVMRSLAPELGIRLAVFHLNHCVRGTESYADEAFLKDLCARDSVPAVFDRHDFSEEIAGFEEKARDVRYTRIRAAMTELGCSRTATAHTMSDQAETVLMRECTGTHIRGLEGISPKRAHLIRPLLFATSDEIYGYLREQGIAWREDASNADVRYSRNFLRHEILPALEKRFPGSSRNIASVSAAAAETQSIIHLLLAELGIRIERMNGEASVGISPLLDHSEIFGFCVAEIVAALGGYLSRERIDEAFRRFHSAKPELVIYDGGEIIVERTRDRAKLVAKRRSGGAAPEPPIAINMSELPRQFCFGNISYSAEISSYEHCATKIHQPDALFISLDGTERAIVVRPKKNGDHIRSGGMTRKIKQLLADAKCGNRGKEAMPVIEIDGTVAAAGIGFVSDSANRISDNHFVHVGSKKILAIYRTRPEC